MAQSESDVQAELDEVRCAMRAQLSTEKGSVGLVNGHTFGDRTEQGMRPTYAQLQQREQYLITVLARFRSGRGMTLRTSSRDFKGIHR